MRQLLRSAVMIFGLAGLSTLLHAGVVTFDFEADTGLSTGFIDATFPIATFTSSTDPGGFLVLNTGTFQSLTGNFLIDLAPSTLTILFTVPQTSISMNFATSDVGTLNLSALLGAAPVGNNSASGTAPGGAFTLPEGVLGFNGGTFDTVVLSATTPNFAIDNVTVSDAVVNGSAPAPEPGSLLLCAGALAALSFVKVRRSIS